MFLRLIVRYTTVKRVCSVLCFEPFKIPSFISCGLHRNCERDNKPELSCCKIRPIRRSGFRCPLQSAYVRQRRFFIPENHRNIAPGTDPASAVAAEDSENFGKTCSGADSYPRQRVASCTFVRQIGICPTKVLALRGRAFSRVERLFNRYYEYRPKTDRQNRKETSNAEL